jgi:LacI family transcriptional regulator
MKKDTLLDIAQKSGCSITTVSRVLNGKSGEYRISKITEERILGVVKELNYKPNYFAQSLRKSKTHTIGLLVPHINNPFFANIANVVIREAQKFNYMVILIDTMEKGVLEDDAVDTMLSRNIDGLIIVPSGEDPQKLESISLETPIVLIDRYFENNKLPYVSTNNYKGAYEATKLLLESGHRRILCIQGPRISSTTKEQVRGFMDAMHEFGHQDEAFIRGNDFSIQNGYIETKMMLSSGIRATAIFALSNMILLGVVKALKEHKLNIPNDISIISFDDNLYLDYLDPPISRVVQPIEEIGMIAVKMLMQKITDNKDLNFEILLEPTIIKRESIKLMVK